MHDVDMRTYRSDGLNGEDGLEDCEETREADDEVDNAVQP